MIFDRLIISNITYDAIKKAVESIKADTTDSKAVTYAQILLERIVRYELAISVINTLKQQDESLATTREKIEKARQAELESVHRDADFIDPPKPPSTGSSPGMPTLAIWLSVF